MFKKRFFTGVLIVCLLLGITGITAAADIKVGYVDMDEIYQSHPELRQKGQKFQQKAKKLESEYRQEMEDLNPEEDKDEVRKVQQKFQSKINSVRQNYEEEKQKVKSDLEKATEELGLDVILKKDTVISGGEDVTDKVINYFNEELGEGQNQGDQMMDQEQIEQEQMQ